MKWVHINKYGVNEMFDAEMLRNIGFAKDGGGSCVTLIYHDGQERIICSDELARSADKCHELMRDIAKVLEAAPIVKAVSDVDKLLKKPL